MSIRCPRCGTLGAGTIETRDRAGTNQIRRRRECENCGHRFTTYESIAPVNAPHPLAWLPSAAFSYVLHLGMDKLNWQPSPIRGDFEGFAIALFEDEEWGESCYTEVANILDGKVLLQGGESWMSARTPAIAWAPLQRSAL